MGQQEQFFRTSVAVTLVACGCLTLAGCGDDLLLQVPPVGPPKGIVVMDGYIQPGLTLLADTGTSTSRITFGPSTEFDAGGFTLRNDTALAVSSRGAGDLLYIADLQSGSMRRLQMPAVSNPGKARLLSGGGGQALIAVALRDSSSIALVSVSPSGTSTSTRIADVGRCPTDVMQYDAAIWVVDANADCRTNYAVMGDVRLIRIPTSGARDTIIIPGMRGSGASIIVSGDVAYVSAGGDADFSSFPYALISTGQVTRIDLRNRRVLSQRAMPASSYGASTTLGLDGYLYVSLYEDLSAFQDRVLKLNPTDLTFQSTAAVPWLSLTDASGQPTSCGSATADALGRVHCIVTGAGSATSLLVCIGGDE